MTPEESNDLFQLALAGVPFSEIASSKGVPFDEAQRAIELEVSSRVDTDEFRSLGDALEYLRLGRMRRGLWAAASRGGVAESSRVVALSEKQDALRKKSRAGRTLSDSVRDMLEANNVTLGEDDE